MELVKENKAGFQNTKVGWIPDSWGCGKLKNISNIVRGGSPRPAGSPLYFNGDFIPWLTVASLTRVQPSQHFVQNTATMLTEEGAKNSRVLNEGTLILSNSGATLGIAKILGIRCCANDGIAAFLDLDEKVLKKRFLYFYLNSISRYLLEVVAPGNGQPNLNTDLIGAIDLPIPHIAEQKKIAEILSTWDDAISKTQQLIDKLKLRKKGLAQQLLTGKKRLAGFDGEWEEASLKKFIKFTPRPVEKPEELFFGLGIRSHGKGIFHKPDFDPTKLAIDTLYEVKEGDLILNITFAWEHAIALAGKKDDGGLVSHRFPTYTFKSGIASANFFKHLVLQPRFKYQLVVISPGGAGRNRVMSKKDFLTLPVTVPTIEEQQAIAKVLQTADKEIELRLKYLAALQQQKKGLMQQLLTGKTRVTIND